MTTVREVLDFLDSRAPLDTQLGFDNAGFLCGDLNTPVTKVVTALDITDKVLEEAAGYGAADGRITCPRTRRGPLRTASTSRNILWVVSIL